MTPLPLHTIPGNPETALVLLKQSPGAAPELVLLPNLRFSGLLHILPPELLQALVALLTFQEGRGEVRASVAQMAETLQIHLDQADSRFQQLTGYTFDGASLVFQSGEGTYSLSKRVGVPVVAEQIADGPVEPPIALATREEVIEMSRERYATSRAEAEAMVAEQLGIDQQVPIPEGREGDAFRGMLTVGVPEPEARAILQEFEIAEIEQQLSWLPERGARNPARFLVAAIRGRYESPEARRGGQL